MPTSPSSTSFMPSTTMTAVSRGRNGSSDIYYTAFGMGGLLSLDASLPANGIEAYLRASVTARPGLRPSRLSRPLLGQPARDRAERGDPLRHPPAPGRLPEPLMAASPRHRARSPAAPTAASWPSAPTRTSAWPCPTSSNGSRAVESAHARWRLQQRSRPEGWRHHPDLGRPRPAAALRTADRP